MKRYHLFEWEDQAWLPRSLRDGVTDFLRWSVITFKLYRPVAPVLSDALDKSSASKVVDLCTGAGGPWQDLLRTSPLSARNLSVTLTDFYPNTEALKALESTFPEKLRFESSPVDAKRVPGTLRGFRTLFSSFHHFPPQHAQMILADAIDNRCGIAVFETTQRHVLVLLYMMLVVPFVVFITAPFLKPFRWSRLFWTYVVPILPFLIAFDGFVSALRTYTPDEILEMAKSTPRGDTYEWQAGIARFGLLPVGITYLIGVPISSSNASLAIASEVDGTAIATPDLTERIGQVT
ncbi:MAG: hypothetical protein ACK4KV_03115 [Rhodocyclaceae bacterium]